MPADNFKPTSAPPARCAGIILAGGRSSRFGRDKANAPWEGCRLIDHTAARLRSVADVLIAAARYLAAHAPTMRAQGQTFNIAQRLARGERLFEEAPQPETTR